MQYQLQKFPPTTAEGFAAVQTVSLAQIPIETTQLCHKLQKIQRSPINRRNRTEKYVWHQYSQLLDFERLIYLIALLIHYPGLGYYHQNNPVALQQIDSSIEITAIKTTLAEISVVMAACHHPIYANQKALEQDLAWLENNGFTTNCVDYQTLKIEEVEAIDINPHSYSDKPAFERLLKVIRFILNHPFIRDPSQGMQNTLMATLQKRCIITENCRDAIRKDIERILKPYHILESMPYKRGYFVGTGILTASELTMVFQLLQAQSAHFDDPRAVEITEILQERMQSSRWLKSTEIEPIRVLGGKSMVNLDEVPNASLAKQTDRVETAISEGQQLELKRLRGRGGYDDDPDDYFCAYPLQLVYHNIAWYLGYEEVGGDRDGLLRFERLDRLCMGRPLSMARSRREQTRSRSDLMKLYQASAGLYLGNNPQTQRQFLKGSKAKKAEVNRSIELWASDRSFRFISEGTQRFGGATVKMSPPPLDRTPPPDATAFCLKPTGNSQFPHRLILTLPYWSLEDIDFRRWILGFGGELKVISPPELIAKLRQIAQAIAANYESPLASD